MESSLIKNKAYAHKEIDGIHFKELEYLNKTREKAGLSPLKQRECCCARCSKTFIALQKRMLCGNCRNIDSSS